MPAIANHPPRVTFAIAEARSSLASVRDLALWSMDPTETAGNLAEVQAAKAQLAELEAWLLAHADGEPVRGRHPDHPAAVAPLMHLAKRLEAHEQTRTALAEGTANLERADVILRALDELPDDLDPELLLPARGTAARPRPRP
jgi:hypothetical protein